MAPILPSIIRFEPSPFRKHLEAGFKANIHDPVWFLARQWHMGEHQGENASSPIWVDYDLVNRSIDSADARFDPKVIPAEAIVESELYDWWTMGRRVRIGKTWASHPSVQNKDFLLFNDPPPPYEHFKNQVDGFAVWQNRDSLNISDANFGEVPEDSIPAWDNSALIYQQTEENSFKCDKKRLTVTRHRGGRLDWYSVDAFASEDKLETVTRSGEAIPTVLQYPGAPNSRWWQYEDAEVDIGSYVPDSAHTPTAFLTDLIFSHSDDWFLFPVLAKAGNVVALEKLVIKDVFGRTYDSTTLDADHKFKYRGLQPPEDWTTFQVHGLNNNALLLWHVAEMPLESLPLEKVQFGLDEHSNLLWAVERIVDGRDLQSGNEKIDVNPDLKFNSGKPKGNALPNQDIEYAYIPATGIVPYWHPYELDETEGVRKLVQRSLADYSLKIPAKMPAPIAKVLESPSNEMPHTINPLAIPSNGIELERRWQLARDMHGAPILWIQRKRAPLVSPPARLLRFDVMEIANF